MVGVQSEVVHGMLSQSINVVGREEASQLKKLVSKYESY